MYFTIYSKMECKYCNRYCKNNNSLRNHERLCKLNENRQILKSNLEEYNKKRKELGIKGTNHYIKAKNENKPIPIVSKETREKISLAAKGKVFSEERKKQHSEIMKEVVKKYPKSYSVNNVSGRTKNIKYKEFILKGNWELNFAKYLDINNIKWTNIVKGIEYEWNDSIHLYFPDFYLIDYDVFIEIKGFERERDYCKWKSLKNLIIIRKKEIEEINKNIFNIYLLL